MAVDPALTSLELFAECDPQTLLRLSESLEYERHAAGDVLIRQGDPGTFFVIVLEGRLAVSRIDRSGPRDLGTAGPGSILGELAMLRGRSREATVTATTPVRVAIGGSDAFDLLVATHPIHDRLMTIAAGRLAENASPIPVTLRDGTRVTLRPLIPDDRGRLDEVIRRAPTEMLRNRFFTSGPPSPQIVDYLVNINYVDHFAWWVMTADDGLGVGVGRYVRLPEDPACAELAFAVTEAHQSRGIGTLLLGALAVAASTAGIEHFSASVLGENASMRAVLDKVGARWRHAEPGVLSTRFPVESAIALAAGALRAQIERVAYDVVTGAGLALTRR